MLIHITPCCAAPIRDCVLVGLRIDALGVEMGLQELATGRPYPNKHVHVGARRIGQKAVEGFLFETQEHVDAFTVVATWRANGSHVATHTTEYQVLDREFDAVTDHMRLWDSLPVGVDGPRYQDRWPASLDGSPSALQPRMEILGPAFGPLWSPKKAVVDEVSRSGLIVSRVEKFQMHTVERGRIVNSQWASDRMPPMSSVWRCDAMAVA